MIALNLYPAKIQSVRWIDRTDGALMLDTKKGTYHKLNKTAAIIWGACNGINSINKISFMIATLYDIHIAKARKDVSSIVGSLEKRGLIKLYKSPKIFYPA